VEGGGLNVQALALTELRKQAIPRGGGKRLSYELGVSKSTVSNWVAGRHPLSDFRAEQILEKFRREDLRLAAKIEAEILSHVPLPEPDPDEAWEMSLWPKPATRERPVWCTQCDHKVTPTEAQSCRSEWCRAK
jgi:hypothetical protein